MSDARCIGAILAGGEGTRLRPLSYYFQKCMIPIGNKQKPLLEYVIRILRHHSITDLILLVGYKHEQIENYFDDGSRFGVNLTYAQDSPTVKGTGAALLNLCTKGLLNPRGLILVYYGDILSNLNLTEMLNQHRETNATATLALAHGYHVPVGVAGLEEKKVTSWVEKPTLDLYAGIGILALNAKVLNDLPPNPANKKDLDITRDIIPYLIEKGESVHAYVTSSFWYDIGSTEKYEKLDNGQVEANFGFLFSQDS